VLETEDPYPGYYGIMPKQTKPNSLYLITSRFYMLEEVLRLVKNMDKFNSDSISFGSAILDFGYHVYNAIRIKSFPDYEQIYRLQSNLIEAGIEFAKKRTITNNQSKIKVFKCFELVEMEDELYFDEKEKHHGYFKIPHEISFNEFSDILFDVRNNIYCDAFDAAIGSMLFNSNVADVVRIYSEKLSVNLLHTIRKKFISYLSREFVPGSEYYFG
jgi:hypothetical protein